MSIEVTVQAGPTIEVTADDQTQILVTAEEHTIEVETGPGGVILDMSVSESQVVVYEVPSGVINGVNNTFATAFNFVAGSVRVFVEGVTLTIVDDFQTIGSNTIQLVTPPLAGESLTVTYTKDS